jgi:hypothetical protein
LALPIPVRKALLATLSLGLLGLAIATWREVTPITGPLRQISGTAEFVGITDRAARAEKTRTMMFCCYCC